MIMQDSDALIKLYGLTAQYSALYINFEMLYC
jgi:hypothetical protein